MSIGSAWERVDAPKRPPKPPTEKQLAEAAKRAEAKKEHAKQERARLRELLEFVKRNDAQLVELAAPLEESKGKLRKAEATRDAAEMDAKSAMLTAAKEGTETDVAAMVNRLAKSERDAKTAKESHDAVGLAISKLQAEIRGRVPRENRQTLQNEIRRTCPDEELNAEAMSLDRQTQLVHAEEREVQRMLNEWRGYAGSENARNFAAEATKAAEKIDKYERQLELVIERKNELARRVEANSWARYEAE